MKKFILFTASFIGISTIVFFKSNNQFDSYTECQNNNQNKISGALEYHKMLRGNEDGMILQSDIQNAYKQVLQQQKLFKASFPLAWTEAGPDNVGGRSRHILVDKKNPGTLYATAVSGGIFKSTNNAASWKAIGDQLGTLSFQSSCQDADGNLYFGSGENTGGFGGGGDEEGSTFPGEGIFKTTDGGATFTQLAKTKTWTSVNAMASSPNSSRIYSANNLGLHYSDDGGANWTVGNLGTCRDVKVASNGAVYIYTGNRIMKSSDGASFTKVMDVDGNRAVIAISPQDPNFVYVIVSKANKFGGLYQSKDAGGTFDLVINTGSQFFEPLASGVSAQGGYNLAMAVHPRNRERVFMGGVEFAEWDPINGGREVASTFNSPNNPTYIHADKHFITFDTTLSPMRMYITCDGGIFRSTNSNMSNFAPSNIGFNITQFYGLAASYTGEVIGGAQDNGTLFINKVGTDKLRAKEIGGGDGFRCEISQINPNCFFGEVYNGAIVRSQAKGNDGTLSSILDNRVPRFKNTNGNLEADKSGPYINSPFNTMFKLVENSQLSRIFVGANDGLWLVENVINFSLNPTWFKINAAGPYFIMEGSSDGKYLFAGSQNRLIRVKLPQSVLDTNLNSNPAIVYPGFDTLTQNIFTGLPTGRFMTGIAVDKNDANRVVVTFGNYGNSNYVYFTTNALSSTPIWKSVQGNLPNMPVFDAKIINDNPNMVVLGTEFGIWGTTNISAGTVTWVEQNAGKVANSPFPRVPVFEIRQVRTSRSTGGYLYAGTHGRGIWETGSLFLDAKKINGKIVTPIQAYPNPSNNGQINVSFNMQSSEQVMVQLVSLDGKILNSKTINRAFGKQSIQFNTETIPMGTYFVKIQSNTYTGNAKIIVIK